MVPAHLTRLAFMQDSTARSTSEVSAQAGSDNDMLGEHCVITPEVGAGVAGLD